MILPSSVRNVFICTWPSASGASSLVLSVSLGVQLAIIIPTARAAIAKTVKILFIKM
jgi:hypothetical protein